MLTMAAVLDKSSLLALLVHTDYALATAIKPQIKASTWDIYHDRMSESEPTAVNLL